MFIQEAGLLRQLRHRCVGLVEKALGCIGQMRLACNAALMALASNLPVHHYMAFPAKIISLSCRIVVGVGGPCS